ncbi:VOC family protein [Nitratireductor pacificus]|uniref:Glyoxalase/bleomycin resistance protein/dioxygenase n=1 Tax=Nitratireductor pacificus pht-3B TaxID=391937 RepID=K2N6A8_9HYPH|nr:VOC family protein [Nitratireductor pacificus]EKF19658.1 glyoxalase/bleomycin resistance protein/dioxygenase [Nitratireductor pacificus pht-3B]
MVQDSPVEPPCIYPTFRYRDAARMVDWLVGAFGFQVHARHEDEGRVTHAELTLGSSMIMLGETADDSYGEMVGGPGQAGGKSVYIATRDPDAVFAQAQAAGAKILEKPTDRNYGSRDFICADPEGNVWCFGTYWPKTDEKRNG